MSDVFENFMLVGYCCGMVLMMLLNCGWMSIGCGKNVFCVIKVSFVWVLLSLR